MSDRLLAALAEPATPSFDANRRVALLDILIKEDPPFARYVHEVGAQATLGELSLDRVEELWRHPRFWQWHNWMSDSRGFAARARRVAPSNNCAAPAEVAALETKLGSMLPVGYRTFLLEVSDGLAIDADEFFSVETVAAKADSEIAVLEFPISWKQLPATGRPRQRDGQVPDSFWESSYPDGDHFRLTTQDGLLCIGEHDYGAYFLVLRGDLRGVVWGTGADEDIYESSHALGLPKGTKRLPLPTLDAIEQILNAVGLPQ